VNHVILALAQQGGAPAGNCGGAMGSLPMLALMFVVFYFIILRPQQKRAKEMKAMLESLKKGDEVITRGGVIGRIAGVTDNVVTLEIQEKVRVRVLKSYIENKYSAPQGASAAARDAAKPEKSEPASTESKS
jgi:preprotein translocase subunit YajC